MRLDSIRDIGPDYATTLREWRRNFARRKADVRALGALTSQLHSSNAVLTVVGEGATDALAMGAPAVELPVDWSARKVAGYHTPVSGLPRELE